MFMNELQGEAIMEIMEESEVHILVQQKLINVFRDTVAKKSLGRTCSHAYGRHPR